MQLAEKHLQKQELRREKIEKAPLFVRTRDDEVLLARLQAENQDLHSRI